MAVLDDAQVILALTLIVIIICIITQPSLSTVLGLITCLGLTIHTMYRMRISQPGAKPAQVTESFTAANDDAVIMSLDAQQIDSANLYEGASAGRYEGAIDGDIDGDIDGESEWPPTAMGDVNLGKFAGTYDRAAAAQETAGGYYNYGRTGADAVPDPSIDNEANADELDADELNTYQARSRNDAVRVTAGTMNRQRDLDKYLREEVAEAEDRYWWGRQEV